MIATADPLTFSAGVQIDLLPGFESPFGRDFTAEIKSCQGATPPATFIDPSYTVIPENTLLTELLTSVDNIKDISTYPNPTTDLVSITVKEEKYLPYQLQVLSVDGSILQEVNLSREQSTYQFDFRYYQEGMYILQFDTHEQVISKKVFVFKKYASYFSNNLIYSLKLKTRFR